MLATPYLGEKYNIILPGCILLFAGMFILSNIFQYEEKAVKVIKKLDAKLDDRSDRMPDCAKNEKIDDA